MTAGQRSSRRLWALMGTLACAHAALSGALAPGWRFAKYPHLAEGLARGSLTAAEVGDASALYLLLNTWIAPGTLRWVQTVAAAAGVLLVFVLARRLRGPVAGVAAAALYAFAQQVVLFSSVLEPDCFIALVTLAGLTLALVARPSLWRSVGTGVLLGLAVSLRPTAALVVLVALLVEWRSWRRVSRGRELLGRDVHGFAGAWTPPLRATAMLAGVCALTALTPHLLLELREAHELKAAMSAGQVVHQGHRPEGSGVGPTFPLLLKLIELDEARLPDHKPDHQHELYRKLAMADLGPARPTEVERYWFAKTQAFLREHPWAFVQQLGRKVVLGLAVPDHDTDIPEVIELTQAQQVPLVPIAALVFAGLSGALLCARRSRVARAVALAALSSQAVALVFFAQARYGLDVLPLWCVLAGGGAAALVEAARQVGRRLREEGAAGPETIAPAVLPLLLAVLPLSLLAPSFVRQQRRLDARMFLVPAHSQAATLERAGLHAAARAKLVTEEASFPDFELPMSFSGLRLGADEPELALRAAEEAERRFGAQDAAGGPGAQDPVDALLLAIDFAHAGRCERALPLAERAVAAGARFAIEDVALDGDLVAADCLRAQGRPREALARLVHSLDARPGTLSALSRAVALLAMHPSLDPDLHQQLEDELFELHDPASAHFALSQQRLVWGDPRGALRDAEWLLANLPEAAPFAQFQRGLALLALKDRPEAMKAYGATLTLPMAMRGASGFDEAVRLTVQAAGDDRKVLSLALSHWIRRGREDEIRALLHEHPELMQTPRAPGEAKGEQPPHPPVRAPSG